MQALGSRAPYIAASAGAVYRYVSEGPDIQFAQFSKIIPPVRKMIHN